MQLTALCNRLPFASILGHNGGRFVTKTLRLMQLTVILLTVITMAVSAKSNSQSITYSGKEVSLEKLFAEVQRQTNFSVFYNKSLLPSDVRISVDANKMPLEEFLSLIVKHQPLTYSIQNTSITIEPKNRDVAKHLSTPLTSPSLALTLVSGVVRGPDGQPLANATVTIKGTNKGTSTDANGRFELNANVGDVLVISSVGYAEKEIKFGGSSLSISLELSNSPLNEVQIVAYGTTSKRYNTGNVSTVKAEDIQKQPVANPLAALEGRVAGMIITQSTGLPGGAFKVEIRGRSAIDRSITDDQPLFIIDGVPFAPNNGYLTSLSSAIGTPSSSAVLAGGVSPLNSINPQDIASIEILKDADATAIYGSRGANGVVLITTKKGKQGKTQIDINCYYGISQVANPIKTLSTQQYVAMRKSAFMNDGVIPDIYNAADLLVWDTTRYNNFSEVMNGKTARSNNIQISLSGGSNSTHYFIGGAVNKETTVMPGDFSSKRTSVHFGIDNASFHDKLKISLTGNFSSNSNNITVTDLTSYSLTAPNLQIYDTENNLAWNEGGIYSSNPLADIYQPYNAKTDNLLASLLLSYAFTNHVSFKVNFGYNRVQTDEFHLYPQAAQNPMYSPFRYSEFNTNQFDSWIIEPQIDFNKQLYKGDLTILVGTTLQSTQTSSVFTTASGFASDELMKSLGSASSISGTSDGGEYKYEAVFGRVNYNLLNKYIINLSLRRDGSSRFGPEKQFSNFGAVGAAWIFVRDRAYKAHNSFISFGKIRGSYGITGNDKISNYQYLDTWSSTYSDYNGNPGLYPSKLYNPDYRWERTKKLEFAVELGLIKDKMFITASYYRDRSSNQLVQYSLPSTTGFTNVISNLPALVENRGLELTVTTTNISRKDFLWKTSANLTIPKNRLASFPGIENSSYRYSYVVGQPLNLVYRYRSTGVDTQTGLYIFEDVNGDGLLSPLDYQVLGSLDPSMYGGIQNSLKYKNIELDFFFSFRKQRGYNFLNSFFSVQGVPYLNLPVEMTDYWTKPGDVSQYQRLSQSSYSGGAADAWNYFKASNGIISDASFVRLKNISLAYNLNDIIGKKFHFSNSQIYVRGENLLTFSSYKIGDPETQSILRTPPLRTLVVGLHFTF